MNTFIYPVKDTYISSEDETKNFGIDEILELKAKNKGERIKSVPGSYWVEVPESKSTIGKKGQVAYDDSLNGFYCYISTPDFSGWEFIELPEGITKYQTHFVNFFGNLYNSGSSYIYLDGKTEYLTGTFTGSIKTDSYVSLSGQCTTGSFTGTIYSGAEFESLNVNGVQYNSPLTENVSGTGYFEKFTGSLEAMFASGRGDFCFGEGYFVGTIEAQDFIGTILAETGSFEVTNTDLYINGGYNGEIRPEGLPEKIIDAPNVSRILLYYNLDDIFTKIQNNEIENPEFNLRMVACSQRNIPFNYKIFAYPISQSWDGGNGRLYFDEDATSGVSWLYRDYKDGSKWYNYNLTASWKSVDYFSNPDYVTESFSHGGGTWYSDYQCSESFNRLSQGDININVNSIVEAWKNNEIPNEGFILMLSNEVIEPNKTLHANTDLQFYSRETNTIYSPALQVSWDDSIFNTGSLLPASTDTEIMVNLPNIRDTYKAGEIVNIEVFSRNKYQLKQFNKAYQQPYMVTPMYLPEESYYMLKDAESEMVIYDYNFATKLSCDPVNGNYFMFDTTGLVQERYYTFFIKSKFSNGVVKIFTTDKVFKIVR